MERESSAFRSSRQSRAAALAGFRGRGQKLSRADPWLASAEDLLVHHLTGVSSINQERRGLRVVRGRVSGSTSNPTWRKCPSVVITVVSFNSRMIAKLVQAVNDRSRRPRRRAGRDEELGRGDTFEFILVHHRD